MFTSPIRFAKHQKVSASASCSATPFSCPNTNRSGASSCGSTQEHAVTGPKAAAGSLLYGCSTEETPPPKRKQNKRCESQAAWTHGHVRIRTSFMPCTYPMPRCVFANTYKMLYSVCNVTIMSKLLQQRLRRR
jgi:hypothetical protein